MRQARRVPTPLGPEQTVARLEPETLARFNGPLSSPLTVPVPLRIPRGPRGTAFRPCGR